ncbi:hypothetical protein F2P81_015087 [Scophthalmus maximus]|uniref:Zinc-binding protein A33-like n=1 Tax=Scophthalmus maximus TaxID=52904 RepID=A0A6A4SHT9_SCOMX|nr:hypothetical protein F2P81_015087 [Scophthalmus maximus]
MSLPEEDLTCPVCCDIFTDPVLLSCSHSFCRSCVKRCWETGLRECPVCRKRAGSKFNPPSNLALRNVCASLLQVRSQAPVAQEEKTNCGLHGERLKLFCLVDKQPICVVCQSSKLHKTHDCSPIEEAVLDCKDELAISLKILQEKVEVLTRIQQTSAEMSKYIKDICCCCCCDRSESNVLGSDNMSGLLIDVTNHLCNLKYRVWEKMLDHIDYTPVTLDPNTAHPCLILSDNLTSLHYSKQPSCCPDNPERFHISAEVVAMSPLGSGSHHWVVETGSNQDWLLGVVSLSVPRNGEVSARPENGFWTLCFRHGEFRAMTSPPTPLTLSKAPRQIKVQLDYDKGTVSFVDPADNTVLCAFTHTFTETLLPYFYTQSSHPLRIMPEKVLVTMLRQ